MNSLDTYIGKQESWSNLYGRNRCDDNCGTLFPHKAEKWLKNACKDFCSVRCTSKCKCPNKGNCASYPTKQEVLDQAGVVSTDSGWSQGGVTTNTTPTTPTTSTTDTTIPIKTTDTSPQQAGIGGMLSNKTTLIIIGVLAIGSIGYFMFKK